MADALIEQLIFLANRVDWRSGIDIALIAVGVLLFYRTVRLSGTYRILVGITLGIALFYLALLLELSAILWVFSNFANVLIIFLIVLFQPELRRIFSRAASLKWNRRKSFDERLPGIFSDAVFVIQRKHRGALLVFPGRESIEPWTSGGFAVDGIAGVALIDSIFDPGSAGHDGAIVIENGRVSRFGVRLPVSTSGRLPARYGTRHHAAMGMSEQTDALIVLVSEERGEVLCFERGEWTAVRDRDQLEARIAIHLGHGGLAAPPPGPRWRLLWEVGLSLTVGLVVWAAILLSEGKLEEVVIQAPVDFRGRPAGLTLASSSVQTVDLRLSGSRARLARIDERGIVVVANLARLGPGESAIPVTANTVRLPPDVHLLRASPDSIAVILTPGEVRMASIRPELAGELPEGLRIAAIEIEPARLAVYFTDANRSPGETPTLSAGPVDLGQFTEGPDSRSLELQVKGPPGIRPAFSSEWPRVQVRLRVESGDEDVEWSPPGESPVEEGQTDQEPLAPDAPAADLEQKPAAPLKKQP